MSTERTRHLEQAASPKDDHGTTGPLESLAIREGAGEKTCTGSDGADALADASSETTPETAPSSTSDPAILSDLWGSIQEALQRRVQREQFETWFRRANLQRIDETTVCVAVQNEFAQDWLRRYYVDKLEGAVSSVLGAKRRIEVVVDPELIAPPRPNTAETGGSAASASPDPEAPAAQDAIQSGSPEAPVGAGADRAGSFGEGAGPGSPAEGSPFRTPPAKGGGPITGGLLWNSDVVLNPQYTFENFVVGPCNRFGHAAAMGAGESPGRNYNPFFLHGRVGVGKTHLLQAVCYLILERWPESRILYLSCETFVNHFISALENGDLTEFRNKYRNVDVLVVDDIHLLANKERTQEEFFHTFNTLYNAGKQIVLSSDSPPKDIPTLQERLVSRFKWGMVTEIEPPCYETRMAIVKRKAKDRGIEIPDEVAQQIAERLDQNVRELEGAVTRLIGYSSMTGKPLTAELAREALADLLQVRRGGAPSMDDIVSVVTDQFDVKLTDLQSKKRTRSIAYPRQIAMFLARKVTRHSLEEIGRYFGGRDHSTVLYAVDRIQKEIDADAPAKELVTTLLVRLQGGSA